ncbi:MAG: hypothetical protein J6S60_05965 [Oscillospiraceae bacterium]|nr:hypothetical protein [Oscillospiraceae bacterium]
MLPKLPNTASKKRTQEIVAFRGLNRTENTRDGDLCDATNISTAQFPTLTPREKRTAVIGYTDPTDIFAWDGHLVTVDGGVLKYDGAAKGTVAPGKKQFAVVNTKLCIWPDKVYIDLRDQSFGYLDAFARTNGQSGSVTVTETTFTAALTALYYSGRSYGFSNWDDPYYAFYMYTYGQDQNAVRACYTSDAWNLEALSALEREDDILQVHNPGTLAVGDIFIPAADLTPVSGRNTHADRSEYNTSGYYAIITNIDGTITPAGASVTLYYDVYRIMSGATLFSSSFRVGDAVTISGTKDGTANVKHAIIRGITDATNTLTFDEGTFTVPGGYDTSTSTVTITRDVPALDYIFAKDNRLWGVSNSQSNEVYDPETKTTKTWTSRVIYASALGDPSNWWVFDGLDSDSYQVAVGSEGDFTALCAYGGAVCAWKEDRLYKILGSNPSDYYMHESMIEGVAAGSERSVTVVNETLYYNGATGVYAYAGNVPALIGYPLGVKLANAVGGSNGQRWYLSGVRPDGSAEMLVYDLTHQLWTREDGTRAEAFADVGGTLYALAGGGIFAVEQGPDSAAQWSAELVAFNETAINRKYYLRILLRLEMEAGSSVTVQVKYDNGAWITRLNADATAALVKNIALAPKRCDRMTVRISGTGRVLIRHMAREFIPGSERP